ncbi:hypothetical protein [Pectinatus brassicae]|uniref:Uncharacterized protein n=1 Tax=Pectinatus brassicae TaxID=862415 RepID=A0A840UR97_9FIRM|nr:hypothetical protein [Pectinatus brassicae]MBB5335354.1 hypothetical protein [Pectinatus brassicae]
MQKPKEENTVNMDGVNLLVSILLRYPEIGTISFDPETTCLKITFTLDKMVVSDEFENFKTLLTNSISAYHYLENIQDAKVSINTDIQENTLFMHILRDMDTVSQNEIKLISTLMNEHFGDAIIKGSTNSTENESMQEDIIDHMLGSVKLNHVSERIIGIWEEGRVLVFNN